MYSLTFSEASTPLPDGATLKVGRAPSNDVVCDDTAASRFHGEFKVESGQLSYRDLESTNGTQVNGNRVPAWAWQILGRGDVIGIGEWRATVESGEVEMPTAGPVDDIPTPAVDPSAPQQTFEVTRARAIPEGLIKD